MSLTDRKLGGWDFSHPVCICKVEKTGENEGSVSTDASCPIHGKNRQIENIAREFHDAYERLAPSKGWETQERSRTSFEDLPPENRELMIAVVAELIANGIIGVPR